MRMNTNSTTPLKDGDQCMVIDGTHKGKSGKVSDLHTSKTGHTTITVKQNNAVRFKTLRKNVLLKEK
ncbi:KOW motif-containing protein [Pedobacter psychrodurus]|uniref:KOW motif-containing protein n=1 Tax=Pedobacter psychrodurus TaxID=2530456 RepID=UPI00292E7DB4|nr:KOW motif-containing protein [Pedobacter psychrodurus]